MLNSVSIADFSCFSGQISVYNVCKTLVTFLKNSVFIRFFWPDVIKLPVIVNMCRRKVERSRLSWFVAHLRIFKLLMKGKFDAYVLWPLSTRVQNWIVDGSSACDFTVFTFWLASCLGPKKQGFCPKLKFSQMKICYRISLKSILSWIISPLE